MRPAIPQQWSPNRTHLLLLALLPVLLPAGLAMRQVVAQDDGPNVPSAARVGQAVIAQGVSEMPAPQIAWRVVRDTAELPGSAEYESRALGFALAAEDAILISNRSIGQQTLLAQGEASFVPAGSDERRESMGDTATSLYRIALVPADQANEAAGDELIHGGAPFDAPSGRRDVSLVAERGLCTLRDSGRSITRTAGDSNGFPILIVVTDGTLEIMPRAGEPVRLEAGQAIEISPTVTLKSLLNTDRCTSYVIAVIGPRLP
jgi:hypothetical protein